MKNKKLSVLLPALTLLLGTAMGLTACGGNEFLTSDSSQTSQQGSQGGDTVAVTGVSLNKTSMTIEVDGSETLVATIAPTNASTTTVTWSSSDENVAIVSRTGVVKGIAPGSATITVTTTDGGHTATCAVTVEEAGSKYGSVDNPLSVQQVLALAAEECAEADAWTAQAVTVKGYVHVNPTYKTGESGKYAQSVYVTDTAGDETYKILAYTINYAEGKEFYQNDQIIFHGYVTNYSGTTIEFSNYQTSNYPTLDSIVARGTSAITYVADETQVTLDATNPATGTNASEVSFKVTAKEGYQVGSVSVNGADLEGNEGVYSFTMKGNANVVVSSSEAGVTVTKVTAEYTDNVNDSTNMVVNKNNAAALNLDPSIFYVKTDKKGSSTECGLNKAGNFRLYNEKKATGNGGEVTFTGHKITITKVGITLASTNASTQYAVFVDDVANAITPASGIYEINASHFTIKNTSTSTDSAQLHMSAVEIYYTVDEDVHATGISVNPTSVEIDIGEETTTVATMTAEGEAVANDAVVWKSADENIATVADGVIKGVAAGETTITVFADANENGEKDTEEFSAEVAVTVKSGKKIAMVDAPVVGVKYKAGIQTQGSDLGANYYLTGAVDGYNLGTTIKYDDAPEFELVATEGGYNVKVTYSDDSVKYLNITVSGNNRNFTFDETATTVFEYNATAKTLTVALSGHTTASKDGTYYMGTYTSKSVTKSTLTTSLLTYISGDNASKVDVSQFPLHFFKEVVPTIKDAPVTGVKYKAGIETKGSDLGANYFLTGAVDGYNLGTTIKYDDGADFELVATEGGYNVKVTYSDDSVKYLNVTVSQNNRNFTFDDAATTVFEYNDTVKTLTVALTGHSTASKDGTYYMGTYTSGTSTKSTLTTSLIKYVTGDNASKVDVSQFPLHFYELA